MPHLNIVLIAGNHDSPGRLVIGGAEALPVSLFGAEIAYVALGHLHLAQRVGGYETRRYSGSPLPLSFTETRYRHQVLRVDLDGADMAVVEILPIPRFVDLLQIPTQAAPLAEVLPALAALDLPEVPDTARPYLEVRVQLEEPAPLSLAGETQFAPDHRRPNGPFRLVIGQWQSGVAQKGKHTVDIRQ